MTDIRIQDLGQQGDGEHDYGVAVVEGEITTNHKVRVTDDFLDTLAMPGVDESRVVHETIAFLLDREKSTGIYEEFDLDVVSQRFPDYLDELRTRLT